MKLLKLMACAALLCGLGFVQPAEAKIAPGGHFGDCPKGYHAGPTDKCIKDVVNCPMYMPPLCKDGEKLVGGEIKENGCEGAPKCVPQGRFCEEGYHPGPTDKCIKNGVNCPMYMPPLCKDGEKLVGGEMLPNGCEGAPKCMPGKPVSCPVFKVAACKPGETMMPGNVMPNGCKGAPKCVAEETSCPLYNIPKCPSGKIAMPGEKDENGCEGAPVCTRLDPKACKTFPNPRCREGFVVVAGEKKPDSCEKAPKCVKEKPKKDDKGGTAPVDIRRPDRT